MAEELSPERIRLQRCRNHDTCLCDHVDCCGGWIRQAVGDETPARRCPRCYDAVLMRAELVAQREKELRRRRYPT